MSSKCNRCNQDIKWPENFSPGNKPLNLDNSVHSCNRDTTPTKKPSTSPTGITENALTAATVLSEIENIETYS